MKVLKQADVSHAFTQLIGSDNFQNCGVHLRLRKMINDTKNSFSVFKQFHLPRRKGYLALTVGNFIHNGDANIPHNYCLFYKIPVYKKIPVLKCVTCIIEFK